jgi:excisionase family DNA binding protein
MTLLKPASIEPLVVTPREACTLLGIGNTRLYKLIGDKEIDSYREGRARRIPLSSIKSYVARHVAQSAGRRPRGRPRKMPVQPEAVSQQTAGTA